MAYTEPPKTDKQIARRDEGNRTLAESGVTAVELALVTGDLSKLTSANRLELINRMCESTGINPITRPFDYLTFQGKLVVYGNKSLAEQLRKRDDVSLEIVRREMLPGNIYMMEARATLPNGRTQTSAAYLPCPETMAGTDLCNMLMKLETKVYRRVTLAVCGMGFMDYDEDAPEAQAALPAPDPVERPALELKPKPAKGDAMTAEQQSHLTQLVGQCQMTREEYVSFAQQVMGESKPAMDKTFFDKMSDALATRVRETREHSDSDALPSPGATTEDEVGESAIPLCTPSQRADMQALIEQIPGYTVADEQGQPKWTPEVFRFFAHQSMKAKPTELTVIEAATAIQALQAVLMDTRKAIAEAEASDEQPTLNISDPFADQ
jgi:hypothetical protein